MYKILAVEDDSRLNQALCNFPNASGYVATGTPSALAAYDEIYHTKFDLIVSGVMMPGVDGFEFAETIRQNDQATSILFMAAKGDMPSKSKGFMAGTGDYTVKPVNFEELLLRIGALLRRAEIHTNKNLTIGNFLMNAEQMTVLADGEDIPVTVREFNILFKLLSYPKKAFSRAQLMEEFWDADSDATLCAVDMYISKLRFIVTFLILISLAIGQSLMLVNYCHSDTIPPKLLNALVFYWAIAAGGYSLFETAHIRWNYEKPMRQMSSATKQVAEGNFSIKLKPRHTEDHLDYLDIMYLDFNKMVEELSSIEMLKNDFVSNISHEIKTPLAVIQNYTTLIQNESLSPQQKREYADTIYHASEQLTSLVSNVLRLSKLESQSILPAAKPYDVCRQLSDCVMAFADRLEEKQIEFSADMEDSAIVIADESIMEIVWNNLLSNAIKFTEYGGQIMLTQHSDNDSVTISVEDNGCGMDGSTIKHIFEKFYQGDTAHSQEGYGLGLALTAKIVALSGGDIRVASEPGKGSVFTVQLKKQT